MTLVVVTIPGHATARRYSCGKTVHGYSKEQKDFLDPICPECGFDNRKIIPRKREFFITEIVETF